MRARLLLLALLAPTSAAAQVSGDGLLHEAVGSPDNLRISGSVRARIEAIDGQFRPGVAVSDRLLTLRTTLFAEYDGGPVRIGAEFHDARGYLQGRNSSVDNGTVNALEFSQYYLGADLGDALGKDSDTRFTLGRMTMALGSSRLVSRQGFRNAMNSYTGVRLERTSPGGGRMVGFWTMPTVRLPLDAAGIRDNRIEWDRESTDLQLFGFFGALPLDKATSVEIYGYGLRENDRDDLQTTDRRLFTPGVRVRRLPSGGGPEFEVEAMAQLGTARRTRLATDTANVRVRAFGFHGEAGYRWAVGWKPRVTAFIDYYTGDRGGRTMGRFDLLYGGRRFELGPTALYGPVSRSNLVSPGVRLEASPDQRMTLSGLYRVLRLDSASDSFALSGVRDPSGRSGHDAGSQLEAQLRYQLVPKIAVLDVGVARLFKGSFLRNAPNAPATGDTNYGYADLTFMF